MAGGSRSAAPRAADWVDAEYIQVTPPRRSDRAAPPPPPVRRAATGMGMLGPRPPGPRGKSGRAGPIFWLGGCLAAAVAFWVAGGHSSVRDLFDGIGASSPMLAISNVRSRAEMVEGRVALIVDGEIRNEGEIAHAVPPLSVNLVSAAGEENSHRLATLRTPLAPGAKYSFSGRVEMPIDGVKTVTVSFVQ